MSREVDIKALISHIVTGDGNEKCRICMGDTTEGQVYLSDTIMMEGEKRVTLSELLETITGVQVETGLLLPQCICHLCSENIVRLISFIKLCKASEKCWNSITDLFSPTEVNDKVKSIYIIINDKNMTTIVDTVKYKTEACTKPSEVYMNFKRKLNQHKAYKKRLIDEELVQNELMPTKFRCPECNEPFLIESKFISHIKDTKMRLCSHCKKIVDIKDLKIHLKTCHNLAAHVCNFCSETFLQEFKLLNHIKIKHKSGSFVCVECQRSFKSGINLTSHMLKHGMKVCPGCQKTFLYHLCFLRHIKKCVNSTVRTQQFVCDYCHRVYTTKNSLRMHIKLKHLYGWRFQCVQCGKGFPNLNRLQEHDNIHNKVEDRYVCSICQAKYSSRRGYEKHCKRYHTVDKTSTKLNIKDV